MKPLSSKFKYTYTGQVNLCSTFMNWCCVLLYVRNDNDSLQFTNLYHDQKSTCYCTLSFCLSVIYLWPLTFSYPLWCLLYVLQPCQICYLVYLNCNKNKKKRTLKCMPNLWTNNQFYDPWIFFYNIRLVLQRGSGQIRMYM